MRRFSLVFAIVASLACLLGLTWILLSLISFKTAEKDLLSQKSEEARVLLASFIHLLPRLPQQVPGSPAAALVESLARESSFEGLTLVDRTGRPLFVAGNRAPDDPVVAETLKKGTDAVALSPDRRYLVRYAPVTQSGEVVAVCRLSLSLAAEHARLQRSRHLFWTYFLLDALLLIFIGSFLLYRTVVLPIRKLLAATERITAGDYSHPVHVPGSSEIASLAEAFNSMLAALRRKDAAVASHVMSLEKANSELKSAREESIRSEKMASVGLLAAGMAHEIGTPLAAIMGYAGILRDELPDGGETQDYVRRIEEDCVRIDRIVRDLLDYARPVSSHNETVDVARVVTDTVEMLRGQGMFKTVEVELHTAENLPELTTDRHKLQQVLINLLINARDALPAGGKIALRALRITDCGCWVGIEVADNGVGIPDRHLATIFEPFFTTKEPGKGTGLGLAIVARIIEENGGKITVTSREGEGTTFTVLLPADDDQTSIKGR